MIPIFPEFKKLEFSDREEIQAFTKNYPPYSDFNFVSMWSWDVDEKFGISRLNDNLVVEFTDYITGEQFLSFIGINEVDDTIEKLLSFANEKGISSSLKLITEETIKNIKTETLKIVPDRDNYDYILSVEEMSLYGGNKLRSKRNFVNRFKKLYNTKTVLLELGNEAVREKITKALSGWQEQKDPVETKREYSAIRKLILGPKIENVHVIAAEDNNEALIGFMIFENIENNHGVIHFEKGEQMDYIGLYPHLMSEGAKHLSALNVQYINYEQDLGIEGLRKSKLSYKPVKLLEQFIVSKI